MDCYPDQEYDCTDNGVYPYIPGKLINVASKFNLDSSP